MNNKPPCKDCILFAICNSIVQTKSTNQDKYQTENCETTKIFYDNILLECDIINEYLPFCMLIRKYPNGVNITSQYNFITISTKVSKIISRRLWTFRIKQLIKLFNITINLNLKYNSLVDECRELYLKSKISPNKANNLFLLGKI